MSDLWGIDLGGTKIERSSTRLQKISGHHL